MLGRVLDWFSRVDGNFRKWLTIKGVALIRISTGSIYLLFGILKFFPNYSPAQELGAETVEFITLGLFSKQTSLLLLAVLETFIGATLIFVNKRWPIRVAILHMACTFLPLIIWPQYSYSEDPFSLSIVGQYILKNFIIVSALLVCYCFIDIRYKLKY